MIRTEQDHRVPDVMTRDVLGGRFKQPMTNVRDLTLTHWRRLAARSENRCLISVTEFCEWAPEPVDFGDGKKPIRGEMWFGVSEQPIFVIAGSGSRPRLAQAARW